MNILDAAHNTVRSYPGGSESLGPRVGISPAVLRNKVNPNNDTHHLTLAEADRLMGITGDHSILNALASAHGYSLQKVDGEGQVGSIVAAILAMSMRQGDLSEVVSKALEDNRISPRERRDIEDAVHKLQAAIVAFARAIPSDRVEAT